jgi:beta-N-acetylhexosaminidase
MPVVNRFLLLLPVVFGLAALSCAPEQGAADRTALRPAAGPTGSSAWVDSVLRTMPLEKKVAQLIMARAPGHFFGSASDEYARLKHLVADDGVGGLIMLQGDVYEVAMLLNRLQEQAAVPLLVAADYERGVAMRVRRATYVGDAMAIGATTDTVLAYRAGKAIAEEARALGVHQNFAPVADINDNAANPVINTRAFGDDRDLVASMAASYARGTADGGAIATVKHFPGHGSTGTDSHIDLPVLSLTAARLDSFELIPFRRAIDAGVRSVMIAHIAVPAIEDAANEPATLSASVVDSLLRGSLRFEGIVITDALEMQAVSKTYAPGDAAIRAIMAGADILLSSTDEHAAMEAIVRQVRAGVVPESRIDRSVRRILSAKQWLGLDASRTVDPGAIAGSVQSLPHRLLSREIARKSVTLLRNERAVIPIRTEENSRIAVVLLTDSEEALTEIHRPGPLMGVEPAGSYLLQQLRRRHSRTDLSRLTPASNPSAVDSVLRSARRADLLLLAYAVKVRTGTGTIGIPENLKGFVARVAEVAPPTIVLALGTPYPVVQFPRARGVLCAYTDAEPAVAATVEALFGEIPVAGKLPVRIPGSYPFGSGIALPQVNLRSDDPAAAGFDPERLRRVDQIVREAIHDSAFPGAQVAVIRNGMLVYNKAFGTLTYEPSSREVTLATRYDLASLTKVISTTAAVMQLYDRGKLSLDDTVARYIPQFSVGKKRLITIRHLLTHRAGLPPFRRLWEFCPNAVAALDTVYATPLVADPGDSTIYSDLGMIIMGKIVEKVSGKSLAEYMQQEFYGPLEMTSTGYLPPEAKRSQCAPTEVDSAWRKGLVQGRVHDENADFLGGVSGHAGLFSTASDLAIFMNMLQHNGVCGGRRFINDSTVLRFTRRHSDAEDRALGWDFKSPRGSSSGSLFSPSSFGHTGFTGTSIWTDPVRGISVILLTNRVYPTRRNGKIGAVRPALHDAVINALAEDRPR